MDEQEEEEESMQTLGGATTSYSCMKIVVAIRPAAAGLRSELESLLFGEVDVVVFFNLFLIVEFQKFFISLSVLPGRRAAI